MGRRDLAPSIVKKSYQDTRRGRWVHNDGCPQQIGHQYAYFCGINPESSLQTNGCHSTNNWKYGHMQVCAPHMILDCSIKELKELKGSRMVAPNQMVVKCSLVLYFLWGGIYVPRNKARQNREGTFWVKWPPLLLWPCQNLVSCCRKLYQYGQQ